jgi:hypothetical protein
MVLVVVFAVIVAAVVVEKTLQILVVSISTNLAVKECTATEPSHLI